MLDANTRLGSFGINSAVRLDPLVSRVNDYVTGNVTGGGRFQGLVPYRSVNEFRGTLGSSTLSTFRRDSVGRIDLSQGIIRPRPFVDYSRGITRSSGPAVINTGKVYKATKGSSRMIGRYAGSGTNMPMRPLNQSYSGFDMSSSIGLRAQSVPSSGAKAPSWLSTIAAQPELETGRTTQALQNRETPTGQSQQFMPQLLPQQAGQDSQRQESQRHQEQMDPLHKPTEFELAFGSTVAAQESIAKKAGQEEGVAGKTEGALSQSAVASGSPSSLSLQERREAMRDSSRKRFDEQVNRGKELLDSGRYYVAASAFSTAAIFAPDESAIYMAKAHALLGAGEFMTAAFFLDKTLRSSPELLSNDTDIAKLMPNNETLIKRIEEIDRWHESSREPILLFVKGYMQYRMGQVEQAKKTLDGINLEYLDPEKEAPTVELLIEAVGDGDGDNDR